MENDTVHVVLIWELLDPSAVSMYVSQALPVPRTSGGFRHVSCKPVRYKFEQWKEAAMKANLIVAERKAVMSGCVNGAKS